MTTKTAAKQGTGSAPTMHCRGPSPPADAAMTTMRFTVLPYALFLARCRADGRSTVLLTCSRLLGRWEVCRRKLEMSPAAQSRDDTLCGGQTCAKRHVNQTLGRG